MSLKTGYEEKKEQGYLEGEPVPLKEEPIYLEEEPLFLEEPLPLKVEPHLLKEELIWDIAAADLYAEHDIKDDVVVGPIILQPPDAAFAISATETSCKQPTAQTKNATSKPGAQAHRCYICQRTFVDDSLLINHACVPQQVLDARTVPDTVQNLPITDQTNCGLDKHNKIRNYSVGEPIYCDICQKQFKHKSTLKLHRLTHSESFSCKLCNVKFKYENDLDAHYKDHAVFDNENAADDGSGNVASLQLPKWQILIQGTKPNSRKYLIVQQGSKTSTQLDISIPRQNLIQGLPKPNSNANTEQMEHQLHVGPSAYELGKNCPLQRNQNVQSDLSKPKENPNGVVLNTNGPKLKDKKNVYMYCEVCEKQIKVKHNLTAHMRSHVRKKQKIPPPSNKDLQDQPSPKESLISPNDIVVNSYEPKLKHRKEKYMYCDVCKKQIKVKHNLNAHMQAHIRKKQKYCDICKKYFHSKKYLIKHKQRHTGEIFPCHFMDGIINNLNKPGYIKHIVKNMLSNKNTES